MTSINATVRAAVAPSDVEITIADCRDDTACLFEGLDEARQRQLAIDAWTIGLRAIGNAHASAREGRLEDIGKDLMSSLEATLAQRLEHQQSRVDAALKEFFDPEDGKVHQRLQHFMADQGVLARQLEKYLAPDRGLVAETLARQVGENSPLFRMLSPTESDGLVKVLEGQLAEVMAKSRGQFDRALDPAMPDSPISRFMVRLKAELETSSTALDAKLTTALASLDAGNEHSLLSRLMSETRKTQASLLTAMNPAVENSPLAVLGGSLRKAIEGHATVQREMLEAQEARQKTFEIEVKGALVRIETKGRAAKLSPAGGFDFENSLIGLLNDITEPVPCLVTATGDTAGATRGQKVGDAVIEFDVESAFAGNRVVVEAKRAGNYTVASALEEMGRARANREADVGVFVIATSSAAGRGFPVLARHGADIIVQWNDEDAATDTTLRAAIMLALGLVARARAPREEGNIEAMNDVEGRIVKELDRLEKVRGYNETIRRNVEKIDLDISRSRAKLSTLMGKAQSTLRALGVDLLKHELQAEEPLVLMGDGGSAGMEKASANDDMEAAGTSPAAVGNASGAEPERSGPHGPAVSMSANDAVADPAASHAFAGAPAFANDDLSRFLRALERCDGRRSGNLSLCRELGWDQARYDTVRDAAVGSGRVHAGRGRGGTVTLSGDVDAA